MAHKSNSEHPSFFLERLTVVLLGVYLGGVGVRTLAAGHFLYRNYLHTPVLAPVGLAIGAILICAGISMRQ